LTDPISDAGAAAERGEFESAIITLRPLAEAGNREAQYQLGFLALTECDLISGREAFSLFLEASEQGHAEAMYHVATFPEFLSEPFKSPLSDEEAWRWLLRAAEGGCVQAHATLARRSRQGTGVRARSPKTSRGLSHGIGARRKPDILMPSSTSRPCSRRAKAAIEIFPLRESG
jgi:TPR repeat protein